AECGVGDFADFWAFRIRAGEHRCVGAGDGQVRLVVISAESSSLRKQGSKAPCGRFEAPRCRSLCSNGAARLPSAKGPAARHSESLAIWCVATTTCWDGVGKT